ncbi:MAG TPA: Asp-tRNA(Asn)/Glu-tRNA(Gln) amidotransferase subunit GatC [Gemmataceae bacterium]|jgi:aspartyl-tRNA(Asn)/glutamyl-tRNA(Gln) amidotransferase subunit C|nr:Asp-tRNA(Asn)/Glu-tRNA(Gln) amidotransferase subunit GatC [Gemmataceae bacterium]
MAIDTEQVRWVATLARLQLSEADLAKMTEQLSAILEYVDQLKKIPTDGVEPLAHPLKVSNIFRDDEPIPSLSVEAALANAPDRKGDFFGVPPILD